MSEVFWVVTQCKCIFNLQQGVIGVIRQSGKDIARLKARERPEMTSHPSLARCYRLIAFTWFIIEFRNILYTFLFETSPFSVTPKLSVFLDKSRHFCVDKWLTFWSIVSHTVAHTGHHMLVNDTQSHTALNKCGWKKHVITLIGWKHYLVHYSLLTHLIVSVTVYPADTSLSFCSMKLYKFSVNCDENRGFFKNIIYFLHAKLQ